jgi:protein-S-isoprenylcysteine O-methyltransferase Ste14
MRKMISLAVDCAERAYVVLLAIPFLWAFARAMPNHPNLILIALSEGLAVLFILTRRTGPMAISFWPIFAALAGTGLPLLVRPGGTALLPTTASAILMSSGLALSVFSKLYLNRSFGLVAANRGVKIGGPYRFVRHPMYLGYIISQLGFLLVSFTLVNMAIYVAAWAFQVIRLREEESVLFLDPHYRQFAERVTVRLVPGVY